MRAVFYTCKVLIAIFKHWVETHYGYTHIHITIDLDWKEMPPGNDNEGMFI